MQTSSGRNDSRRWGLWGMEREVGWCDGEGGGAIMTGL